METTPETKTFTGAVRHPGWARFINRMLDSLAGPSGIYRPAETPQRTGKPGPGVANGTLEHIRPTQPERVG